MLKVGDVVCLEKNDLFSGISLSARTVTRRIEELSANVKCGFENIWQNLEYYCIAIDKSTDMTDTAQLSLFLRGVTPAFHIVEEFVRLIPTKDTTTGADVFESVRKWTTETNLDLSKLIGVTTDGAPAMTGKKKGFVALLQKQNGNGQQWYRLHCIIHQDQLCAKSLKLKDIVAVVIKIMNFIISRGLNHRQFQEFLRETSRVWGLDVFLKRSIAYVEKCCSGCMH